ncbi:sulfotransferase domain-containing protein [Nevskia ramosa]|uniref:sulfotransferase domain-containing protein n=1 Tax=Nevskia ramosa TaxID=64002 RepID=UPI0003B5B052|nr:sulfotransferase domain-containing protein [Nevskia ramosa]
MRTLPNFLYIGTGRAGSTWLFEALRQHPEVFVTPVKETSYFDLNLARGLDWYGDFFADADGHRAVGEIAHRYWRRPELAAQIRAALGPVKLLVCFRRPEDFVLSAYQFARRNGRFEGSPADWMSSRFEPQSLAYHGLLKPWVDAFGRDAIFIGCFDDLKADPEAFFASVCRFLGVTECRLPVLLHDKVNAAARPRSAGLALTVNKLSKRFKRHGGQRLIAWVKRQSLVQRLLYSPLEAGARPVLSNEARNTIRAIAETELQRLDAEFGTRFGQRWYGAADRVPTAAAA